MNSSEDFKAIRDGHHPERANVSYSDMRSSVRDVSDLPDYSIYLHTRISYALQKTMTLWHST